MEVRQRPVEQAQAQEHVGPPPPRREGYGFGRGYDHVRTRPDGLGKTGTSGTPQKLFANYFKFQMKKTIEFFLYKVTFSPEIETIGKRSKLLHTLDDQLGPYLFEGVQLFTTHIIPPEHMSLTASFPSHPEQEWTVTIQFIRPCDPGEPVVTQLYNVLVKSCQEIHGLTRLGQYYFDATQKIDILHHKLQLWPGFVTSIRQMEDDVLFNVDLTFKVCRTESVYTLIRSIRDSTRGDFRKECEAAIVGSTVMTIYNSRTYKITGINWDQRPTDTFEARVKGVLTQVSFLQYFKKKGLDIQPSQPMLVVGPTKRDIRRGHTGDKILPPDISYKTGIDNEMRRNFKLMKDLATHFHLPAQGRINQIVKFVRSMIENPLVGQYLLRWGARILGVPVDVQGRLLSQELIRFLDGRNYSPGDDADWTAALRNEKMFLAIPLIHWALMYPPRQSENIDALVTMMRQVSRQIGFQVSPPLPIRLNNDSRNEYVNQINAVVNSFSGQQADLAMVFIVLPHENSDIYAAVKVQCTIQRGIPSQCFLAKNTTSRNLRSICMKMLIQMNAKLGGQPWGLVNPLEGLMVIGFDVHHGTGRSYGALAATTSANLASYFSTVITLEQGNNMGGEIGAAMIKCLKAYGARNGVLPSRIIFYRDGVGDGQLRVVVDTEVEAIKSAMAEVYKNANQMYPKFTMIIVTRRINTRIFLATGDKNCVLNPLPGSVVDDVITCPEKYDFYLVAQTARQGTVSPVAFNVIYDTSGLSADQMQRFTFKVCHGYFNWTGTVAVPAPCQYARKLSMLTGTALLNEANTALLNNLHFL